MERDALTNIVKGNGGRVTGNVSRKTNYLVYGSILEDDRPVSEGKKYKTAESLGINLIDYSEFQDLLREKIGEEFTLENAEHMMAEAKKPPTNKSYLKKNSNLEQTVSKFENKNVTDLWTTKYMPIEMDDVIGNNSTKSKLTDWLDDWEDIIINGNKKEVNYSKRGKFENVNARACLISGDPGIGKTTTVRLVAKLKGYRTYELNASDQRNKNIINRGVGYLMDSKTLGFNKEIEGRNLIIMDEVDGMGGNEDRGGIAALIAIIKNTKVPIVCICNDRQSQKLKSLSNHCYDLKFTKPDKRQIANMLLGICSKEGISAEMNALEFLAESVNNDIRQSINFLEMWARTSNTIKFFDMKNSYWKYSKDGIGMMSNFDAATKLFNKQNVILPHVG
jgi:replication factor C subunit 1